MRGIRRSWIHCIAALSAAIAAGDISGGLAQGATIVSPDVVIYEGTYPAWPWIDKTPDGTLLCAWREGTEHMYSSTGKAMLSQSTDGGLTWSSAETIVDAPSIDDRNVAIAALSDKDWILSYNTFTSSEASRAMIVRTLDGGATWSAPQAIGSSSLNTRTRAAVVKLSTGDLLLPYYKVNSDRAMAAISKDNGQTWTSVTVPDAVGFDGIEWSVLEMPDGDLKGLIRNHLSGNDGSFYVTSSDDHGLTWSTPVKTNLRDTLSQSPAQLFLQDGKPWVVYDDARMVSVALATTDDPNLITWNVDDRLPAYQYRSDGVPITDGGYPCSVALGGDRRLIVDYVVDGDNHSIVGYFVTVPEPSTLVLLGMGAAAAFAAFIRRRRKPDEERLELPHSENKVLFRP